MKIFRKLKADGLRLRFQLTQPQLWTVTGNPINQNAKEENARHRPTMQLSKGLHAE